MNLKRKVLAFLMAAVMLLVQIPVAFAGGSDLVTIDLDTVKTNGDGYTIDWNNGLLTIVGNGNYLLTTNDSSNTTRVIVTAANAHITLRNVTIWGQPSSPFSITTGSTVNLTLEGSNTLKFTDHPACSGAGLQVPAGAAVVIDGSGSLTAKGTKNGAGIGGTGASGDAGSITINSGTVTAIAGPYTAGIGGGNNDNGTAAGSGGNITINGGSVTATGGSHAAGIGGACRGAGGNITINGGTVNAIGYHSAAIGGGFSGDTGNVRITGGFVTATAGSIGAGIGRAVGDRASGGGSIVISGGTVFAKATASGMPGLGGWGTQVVGSDTFTDTTTLQITGGSVRSTPAPIAPPNDAAAAPLYLTTVSIQGTDAKGVSNREMYYKIDGSDLMSVRTDESGQLYLWLTAGTHALEVIVDGQLYQKNLEVTAQNGNPYTLVPDGTFVPINSIDWMGTNAPEPTAGVSFDLSSSLEITPYNATYDSIIWSIEDAGSTGAILNGTELTTTNPGTIQLKVTVNRFGLVLKTWTGSVTVKASGGPAPGEQFNLTPGGTYYFDLSAQGIPGTLNSSVPDTSLKWIPFTYAGTVNAYSRTKPGVSTEGDVTASDRSLFVANYNVIQAARWDDFNSGGLIFGKNYSSGGVSYKLRALSVGSTSPGIPASNEWDQILNKNVGFIKNWNDLLTLGQDTDKNNTITYGARGEESIRNYYSIFGGTNHGSAGFRPALEITSAPGTELKTVTYAMAGKGTLGSGSLTSATVVYTGTLTLPEITQANGFNYTDPGAGALGWYAGSTFYPPGATPALATGTILTLGYDPAPAITTTTLPNGTIGVLFNQTLTATGKTPITWSLDGGTTLPDGLSLNGSTGEISGMPTTEGTSTFTIKAENSAGSVTKQLSITVISDPDIAIVNTANSAAEGASYSDMAQAAATDETVIADTLKATAVTAINNADVNVTINKVNYIAPEAGTADNPSGTNGRYTFTVNVKKGVQEQTTSQKSITITATAFTGVTNAQAVAAAKAAIVDGSVSVAVGATQEQKTAAVQSYVNGLLTGNAAGVTAIVTYNSGTGKYDVALSKGSVNGSKSLTMTVNEVATCTVTFSSDGSAYATKTVTAGATIGSVNWPANPAKSGYTFNGWYTGANGTGTAFTSATTVTSTMTVYANWTLNSGGSGGGGGGGGGSGSSDKGGTSPAPTPASTYNANVSGTGAPTATLPVTVNTSAGSAVVNVGTQSGNIITGEGAAVITIPSIPGVNSYTLGIPADYLSTPGTKGTLTFNSGVGSMTLPSDMLAGMAGAAGKEAQITIGQGDKSNLPEMAQAAIGNHPLVQLTVTIDGKQTGWNNPAAPVAVSIPYTPTAAELKSPESIVVWYIDGSGHAVSVPNGHYDAAAGTVTFTTTHFSKYAVGYNRISFNDVKASDWFSKAVGFIAARRITTGTGSGNYRPDAKLTRGEFIVMLMRAYDIAPDTNPKDNFADAGNTYYTNYLAAAKRLGVSGGVGSNLFAPGKDITRQEMFTLLYNALKVIGQLPQGKEGKDLTAFSDATGIAPWAKDAMTLMAKTGTVGGSGGQLSPTATTTRAEMAQVLYNLLSK